MRICGIVTEYNPFHNGHRYHIEQARQSSQCDLLIAVMSGNFVQRGECAIIDKWTRAKVAVEQGCDIVIELPYPCTVQRADIFASYSVQLLALAGIDTLVFGSECGDIARLQAMLTEPHTLQRMPDTSMAKALEEVHGPVSSNDILGLCYLKALPKHITPLAIKRTNGYHDEDIAQAISSATAIRKAVYRGEDVRHTTCMGAQLTARMRMDAYYPYLQTLLLTTSKAELKKRFLVDEGMESLFIKQAGLHDNWPAFVDACISRRFTRSAIQRALLHCLTQTNKQEIDALAKPDFLRVLAFNARGKAHLRTLRDQGVQVASTFSQIPKDYRTILWRTTQLYAYPLALDERNAFARSELHRPVEVKL